MSTTRVIRFHRPGGPDVLSIDEIPLPEPAGNEVRVRVQALALNRADMLWRAGTYIEESILPSRIGYDIAGVVEALGPDVQTLRIGDRVSAFPAASVQKYGNHGETALYPEYALLKYPERLAPHEAVAVNNGLFTAYFPLIEVAGLRRGQYFVATAAGSSTAQAALQIARKIGAKTIGTTRTAAKRDELLDTGFDHIIVTSGEDVTKRILEITGGAGADLIYDPVAGPGLEALAQATKPLGHLVVYGALGALTETTPLPLWALFMRTVKLYAGYKVFDFVGHPSLGIPRNEAATERAKKFIIEGLAAGDFQPRIDRIFEGLDQYADAHRYMESNAQTGKIVIRLAS